MPYRPDYEVQARDHFSWKVVTEVPLTNGGISRKIVIAVDIHVGFISDLGLETFRQYKAYLKYIYSVPRSSFL